MIARGLAPTPGIDGTGSVIYLAASGYVPSDVTQSSDLTASNMEINGIITSPSITEDDLNAGVWDFALVTNFLVNYRDLTMGAMILSSGTKGEITLERNTFKATIAGVAEAYKRTVGALTSASCRHDLGDSGCGVRLNPPAWLALTGYAAVQDFDAKIGAVVRPTAQNGYMYRCTTAGSSGASEPAWNTTVGGSTSDGSVTWETALALTYSGVLTGVNGDNQTLYDSSMIQPGPTGDVAITGISQADPGVVTTATDLELAQGSPVTIYGVLGMVAVTSDTFIGNPAPNTFELPIDTSALPAYAGGGFVVPLGGNSGFFDFGVITFTTGLNAGLSMEVRSYVTGQITLQLPMYRQCAIGDAYTIHAGCAKNLIVDCKGRFNNTYNNDAEYYLPGIDRLAQVGKQPPAAT